MARAAFLCVLTASVALFLPATRAAAADAPAAAPVNIEAKSLSHDGETDTVTAAGDVELVQGGKILHADEVKYNTKKDTVTAKGNVSLLDEEGNVYFFDEVELSRDMKEGYIKSLLAALSDGARFTAESATRKDGNITAMEKASYTPCKVCETDPKPLWQIKADKVVHDQKEKTVSYENARLEMLGAPVFYSPVLSHPDPSVKRKSGFLRPQYAFSSETGAAVQGGYYFGDIAPDKDASLFVRPTALRGTLVQGEWRQRFENGRLQMNGSIVNSDRREEDGRIEQDRLRGGFKIKGLYDIDNRWRAGVAAERVSDKEFLRLYNLERQNVLESEAFVERFDNRDYTRIGANSFQDIRLGIRPEQPEVIPMAEHRMFGAPGGLFGGRWTAGAGLLALNRDGGGQDVQRIAFDTGWQRRDITRAGFVTMVSADIRGDSFLAQDKNAAIITPGADESTSAFRGTALLGSTISYPVQKRLSGGRWLIEPVLGATYAPQVSNTENRIANEDSIDTQLDANNLFAANRFPGIDRIEDGARVNYGLKSSLHGDDGRYIRAFAGQSYRFSDTTAMPVGSGLDDKLSDYVGQLNVGLNKYVNVDYRAQIDADRFKPKRHEVYGTAGNDVIRGNVGYIFLAPVAGTGFLETREQLQVGGDLSLNDYWTVSGQVLGDLGQEPGLRRVGGGLNYADECFSYSFQALRNLTTEVSGESGTTIMMRVGFKNIGQFDAPGIQLGGSALPPPP